MFDMVSFESYLQRRFRRSMGDGCEVVFEATDDIGLLHQYQLLKTNMFIHHARSKSDVMGLDVNASYVVASKGRHCLGGLQITLKEPDTEALLPVERSGLNIAALLKHLPLSSVRCAQISDVALFPDNSDELAVGLLQEAFVELIAAKVRFIFVVASGHEARMYSQIAAQSGFIASEVKFDDFAAMYADSEVNQRLLVIDLAPAYKNKNIKEQHVIKNTHVMYEN